jgi:hypothetical protein
MNGDPKYSILVFKQARAERVKAREAPVGKRGRK